MIVYVRSPISALMYQTDGDVCHHFVRAHFAKFTNGLKSQRHLPGELEHGAKARFPLGSYV
jgi:hypothetical protein